MFLQGRARSPRGFRSVCGELRPKTVNKPKASPEKYSSRTSKRSERESAREWRKREGMLYKAAKTFDFSLCILSSLDLFLVDLVEQNLPKVEIFFPLMAISFIGHKIQVRK